MHISSVASLSIYLFVFWVDRIVLFLSLLIPDGTLLSIYTPVLWVHLVGTCTLFVFWWMVVLLIFSNYLFPCLLGTLHQWKFLQILIGIYV